MEIKTFPSIYLRRHPDSNWGWRICSPLPYRLAMSPRQDMGMLRTDRIIRPSFKYSMRCILKSTIKEMDLIFSPSFYLF